MENKVLLRNPSSHGQWFRPWSREPVGNRGLHAPHPSSIALHCRLNRTDGNKCCPIIRLLILPPWRNKAAQPDGHNQGPHHWDAASSQLLLGVPPRSIPFPTPAPAPHAPSPQLSTPLEMSPKATSPWGHWAGNQEQLAAESHSPKAR